MSSSSAPLKSRLATKAIGPSMREFKKKVYEKNHFKMEFGERKRDQNKLETKKNKEARENLKKKKEYFVTTVC